MDNYLEEISDIWNSFIYDNQFFQSKINFRDNKGTNYFGDIVKYLSDTFVIIRLDKIAKDDYYTNFSNAISFLQAIYIQQDLIEELLFIFSCDSDKGILKRDDNYKKNRQIRNELIGHPIRKDIVQPESKLKLLSSTIFSNNQNQENIAYIRYHRDNGFNSQHIEISRSEIINRHEPFLESYLQEIVTKCHSHLRKYKSELKELLKTVDKAPFESLIKRLEHIFESFSNYDYLYSPSKLIEIYKKQNSHIRYDVVIDFFYFNLRNSIKEKINEIDEYLQISEEYEIANDLVYTSEKIEKFSDGQSFHYELSKLHEKDQVSISLLKERCKQKREILNEIDFLENNICNDLEYYSSYRYLNCILR